MGLEDHYTLWHWDRCWKFTKQQSWKVIAGRDGFHLSPWKSCIISLIMYARQNVSSKTKPMCLSLSSGDQYYQYQFKHQPSHEECVRMTRSSPSVLFTQYTDLFCDQTWEDFFTELFGGASKTCVFCLYLHMCVRVSNQFLFYLRQRPAVTTEALV